VGGIRPRVYLSGPYPIIHGQSDFVRF